MWRRRERFAAARGAVLALALTALVTFAVVATVTAIVSRSIARESALGEARRSARSLATVLFEPALPGVTLGQDTAVAHLDRALADRRRAGVLTAATVWGPDGTVVYTNNTAPRPASPMVRQVLQRNTIATELTGPAGHQAVEVYLPIYLPTGVRCALQLVSPDTRVQAAAADTSRWLTPLVLLSLLLLVLAQLPVSVWLVRSVARAKEERERLLHSALTASDRERRTIARELHDGVVQDLAAAGYALGAVRKVLPDGFPASADRLLEQANDVVRASIGSLRGLMVDIYPPDLADGGLAIALHALGGRVPGTEVTVRVDRAARPSPQVAATLYRCARECVTNIGKHARATRAWVELTTGEGPLRLRVADDGVGPPGDLADRRANGHIGLTLLRDSVRDLGGTLVLRTRDGGGTEVVVELPTGAGEPAPVHA